LTLSIESYKCVLGGAGEISGVEASKDDALEKGDGKVGLSFGDETGDRIAECDIGIG
jgi:hypothetical protein